MNAALLVLLSLASSIGDGPPAAGWCDPGVEQEGIYIQRLPEVHVYVCVVGEGAVEIPQTGPQGPQGIQGVQGVQGPAGFAFSEIMLCSGTATAAQVCSTWTNKSASYVEVGLSASRTNLDLSVFTEFRVITLWSAAAVAADFQIHCDVDAAFGSQALLYQLDNPGAVMVVGNWTAVPANECDTSGGIFIRAGMTNGNTTEDPAVRFIRLQVR